MRGVGIIPRKETEERNRQVRKGRASKAAAFFPLRGVVSRELERV
jgi:hypothetical protein